MSKKSTLFAKIHRLCGPIVSAALTVTLHPGCHNGDPVALNATCGDGVIEGAEVCEPGNLNGETCASLGLESGDLACRDDCLGFDTTGCTGGTCGDGYVTGNEVCDGENRLGTTCEELGYDGGTLGCLADCSAFDTTECTGGGSCGNGIVEGAEVCDGTNLQGESCTSLGYVSGTLSCLSDCTGYDETDCTNAVCGNGVAEGDESCDGTDLAGQSCSDFGMPYGTLACESDCSGVVTDGCRNVPPVLINEIGMGNPDWIELLNTSSVDVELENWTLHWWGVEQQGNPVDSVLTLPAYTLGPGQRVTIEDELGGQGDPPTVAGQTITFHENIWWGDAPGALAFATADASAVDFVRWGGEDFTVPAPFNWNDAPSLWPGTNSDEATLSRVPDGSDTDTSGDFCMALATPNAGNDKCGPRPGALLITEIDGDRPDRVELYNPGAEPVDLEGWSLLWGYTDYAGRSDLPSFALQPGAYVEIVDDAENPMQGPYVENGIIHVRNIDWTLEESGACALMSPIGDVGVDFVRWGQSEFSAPLPDVWTDAPDALGLLPASASLGRAALSDTDTAADWCVMPFTLGEANDSCSP